MAVYPGNGAHIEGQMQVPSVWDFLSDLIDRLIVVITEDNDIHLMVLTIRSHAPTAIGKRRMTQDSALLSLRTYR